MGFVLNSLELMTLVRTPALSPCLAEKVCKYLVELSRFITCPERKAEAVSRRANGQQERQSCLGILPLHLVRNWVCVLAWVMTMLS